jgi:DNA repair photolyase
MKIKLIQTQKVLSPTQISLANYAINPYRGCEFSCLYCYSRANKNIKRGGPLCSLSVKINAPEILEKELRYRKPERVLLGSTTECFQCQELKFAITCRILEILNARGIPYTILTKSHLITNYLSLISQNPANKIYFTYNFSSEAIRKLLEPNSSPLSLRREAINAIAKNNIQLRVHIGPFIPYLSAIEEIVPVFARRVKEIGIELYHRKMGNFQEMLRIIDEDTHSPQAKDIAKIYQDRKCYNSYAAKLRKEIKKISKESPLKFYFSVPDFSQYYTPDIDYEKPLDEE